MDKINTKWLIEKGVSEFPSPENLVYYENTSDRKIILEGEVDEVLMFYKYHIVQWNKEDEGIPVEERKPIKVFIYTPGGMTGVMMHFMDLLELSKTPVYGYNMGECYSAGIHILATCHKRFCLPKSSAMLHQGSVGFVGDTNKVEDALSHNKAIDKSLNEDFMNKTKITEEDLNKHFRDDWYFSAEDQVKYGIVDKIVDSIEELY